MSRVLIFSVFALVAVVGVFGQGNDPCAPHPDCNSCVNDDANVCAWCSQRVIYQDGLQGAYCVSNNGDFPFTCPGVFSKLQCLAGYTCNNITHQCSLTAPGEGIPEDECLEICGPAVPPSPANAPGAQTYQCNQTSMECFPAPQGTGSSLPICQANCRNIPPHVPSAPSGGLPTYVCSPLNFTCVVDPSGGGSSYLLCQNGCIPPPGRYVCNFTTNTCELTSTGGTILPECQAGCQELFVCDDRTQTCLTAPPPHQGVPLGQCEQDCKPSNNTPIGLVGLWRGLQLNPGYSVGEWDLLFDNNTLTISGPTGGIKGTTSFLGTPNRRLVSLAVQQSTVSGVNVNDVLNILYGFDAASPEVRFIMAASGAPNQPAPTDYETAVRSNTGFAWGMTTCQPETHCVFHFANRLPPNKSAKSAAKTVTRHSFAHGTSVVLQELTDGDVNDPCENLPSCAQCLAQVNCGWCTGQVVYGDGSMGKQCAGGGYPNIRFKCVGGEYHADDCNDYQCVQPQAVCDIVPLGHGVSKEDCESTCTVQPPSPGPVAPADPGVAVYICNQTSLTCQQVPAGTSGAASKILCESVCQHIPPHTPSPPSGPAVVAPVYVCNATSWQCYRVTPGTPNSASLNVCEEGCQPPPPPNVLEGLWRGVQIDNEYVVGEFDLIIANSTFKLVANINGTQTTTQGIINTNGNLGGLLFHFDDGHTQAAIYSEAQGQTVLYIVLVLGANANDLPNGWDLPWISGGQSGTEYVFMRVHARGSSTSSSSSDDSTN